MNTNFTLRRGTLADAEACAVICHRAFTEINVRHGFPPDFENAGIAREFMNFLFSGQGVYGVVAEENGKIVGSNFLFYGTIGGIGPITVDADIQERGLGRQLMERVIEHADEMRMPGVRLVQAAFNGRSLSLYTKLGFDVREPLICMQGSPINQTIQGHHVRKMTEADVDACTDLCRRVHGHDRRGELPPAIVHGTALVVERDRRITGYSSDLGFFGHTLGEQDSDLIALIAGTPRFSGPGFLLPIRNGAVFRWCLAHGLRYIEPMTLMSRGLYNEPRGAFLPSILF